MSIHVVSTSQDQEAPASSKIVFSLPGGFMVSGVTTWSVEMTRRINLGGHTALLIRHTPYPGYPEVHYSDMQTLNIVECPGATPYSVEGEHILRQYGSIYRQLTPATFIPNWAPAIYSVCADLVKEDPTKIRIIGYAHSDEPYYYETLQYFEPIISKFVAVSQDVGDCLGKYLPSRKMDILIHPYPVQIKKVMERNYTVSLDRPLRIVYAGRLQSRQKRVYDLVLLVRKLIDQGVNFHLFICGSGPEEEDLRKVMHTVSTTPKKYVTFVGSVSPDKMPRVWKTADICLLVSDFEGTSITMLEAMASGSVPIVTNTSGTHKFIKNKENGFIVEIGDVEEITAIVKMMDRNRNLLVEMGINAHRTLSQHYTYDDYVSWFLRLCEQVWQEPNRSWPSNRSVFFSMQNT